MARSRFHTRRSASNRCGEPPENSMEISVSMTVNGKPVARQIDSRTLLVELLREHLRLTGTHVGCDTAHCGACTVHVNGRAAKSCNILAAQMDGASIVTIEGIGDGELHPMQAA